MIFETRQTISTQKGQLKTFEMKSMRSESVIRAEIW